MIQLVQQLSSELEAFQLAPVGLSHPVPAQRARSCLTRSPAMSLARSNTLHAAQKATVPTTHELFGPGYV